MLPRPLLNACRPWTWPHQDSDGRMWRMRPKVFTHEASNAHIPQRSDEVDQEFTLWWIKTSLRTGQNLHTLITVSTSNQHSTNRLIMMPHGSRGNLFALWPNHNERTLLWGDGKQPAGAQAPHMDHFSAKRSRHWHLTDRSLGASNYSDSKEEQRRQEFPHPPWAFMCVCNGGASSSVTWYWSKSPYVRWCIN